MKCNMKKHAFVSVKTKEQFSCTVNAYLIDTFVFATKITIPLLPKSENFKPLAIFSGCTARFATYLAGNPVDRFSHGAAQLSYWVLET